MNNLHKALFIALLSLAGVNTETWETLHLTYGQFHNIPLTVDGLLEDGYSMAATDNELGLRLYTYKGDPRVAIGVDCHGNVAGIRVNLIKADLESKATENGLEVPFDYVDNVMYKSGTILDTEVYYTTVLFRSPASVAAPEQTENSGVLQVDDVYVKLHLDWSVVPKNACDAPAKGYVKEACIPAMGTHYFSNMSTSFECKDGLGVFGLYKAGSLIGVGVPNNGVQTESADRKWIEIPTALNLQNIIPYERAPCIDDWPDKYGMNSVHIYFVENPAAINCTSEESYC